MGTRVHAPQHRGSDSREYAVISACRTRTIPSRHALYTTSFFLSLFLPRREAFLSYEGRKSKKETSFRVPQVRTKAAEPVFGTHLFRFHLATTARALRCIPRLTLFSQLSFVFRITLDRIHRKGTLPYRTYTTCKKNIATKNAAETSTRSTAQGRARTCTRIDNRAS